MKTQLIVAVLIAFFVAPALAADAPAVAKPKFGKHWDKRRAQFATRADQDRDAVVFLGDSITEGFGGPRFRGQFDDVKTANRGIGGDTTQGVLHRIDEDVLDLDPKAIVILIGTNDIGRGIAPQESAANMKKIIAKIKAHDPKLPVVLCTVFPSHASKRRPTDKIKQLNALYANLAWGDRQITIVDTWTLFADAEGNASKPLFPDLLHLNNDAYIMWAKAVRPVLATLGLIETAPDDFKPEPGFESLFNGKDLTGWMFKANAKPGTPIKPTPHGKPGRPKFTEDIDLASKTVSPDGRYAAVNGRLVVTTPIEGRRFQQMWTTREFPNDFVLKLEFRATPNADSGVFLRKPQLQCRDYPLAGPWKDLKNYKQGGWNELVVTVKGGSAHCTCNGEVLEADFKLPATGPIGLEGDRGQMEYRRIRIKTKS